MAEFATDITILRHPVSSSNVVSIGYDSSTRVLEVEFRSGLYRYADVPLEVASGILGAKSVGKAIAALKGQFETRRMPRSEKNNRLSEKQPALEKTTTAPPERLEEPVVPTFEEFGLPSALLEQVEAHRPPTPLRLRPALAGALKCKSCGGDMRPIGEGPNSNLLESGAALGDAGIMQCMQCMQVDAGPSAAAAVVRAATRWGG